MFEGVAVLGATLGEEVVVGDRVGTTVATEGEAVGFLVGATEGETLGAVVRTTVGVADGVVLAHC
jgi:hypothetical protein